MAERGSCFGMTLSLKMPTYTSQIMSLMKDRSAMQSRVPRTATDPQEKRPQVIDVIVDNHNPSAGLSRPLFVERVALECFR